MLQIRPFWKIPSFLGKVVVAMVIRITSVIGQFHDVKYRHRAIVLLVDFAECT